MRWNYTLTAVCILTGTLVVKLVVGGDNIFVAGGAVPTIVLAAIVLLPIMAVADFVSWRRSRRASRSGGIDNLPPPRFRWPAEDD